jgi:hypothetical protein
LQVPRDTGDLVQEQRAAVGQLETPEPATTPLPAPFSPVINTLAWDGPMRAIASSTGCIARD